MGCKTLALTFIVLICVGFAGMYYYLSDMVQIMLLRVAASCVKDALPAIEQILINHGLNQSSVRIAAHSQASDINIVRDADLFCLPASNNKLLTTSALLSLLQPTQQIVTPVVFSSTPTAIMCVGGGFDPSMTDAALDAWAPQVRSSLNRIDTLYFDPGIPEWDTDALAGFDDTWEYDDIESDDGACRAVHHQSQRGAADQRRFETWYARRCVVRQRVMPAARGCVQRLHCRGVGWFMVYIIELVTLGGGGWWLLTVALVVLRMRVVLIVCLFCACVSVRWCRQYPPGCVCARRQRNRRDGPDDGELGPRYTDGAYMHSPN